MEARKYIIKEINHLVKLFPKSRVRCEYDFKASVHVIEVLPLELYHSNKDYLAWEDDVFSRFSKKYPTENICFISEDSLVGINQTDYAIEGKEFGFEESEMILIAPASLP